MKQSRLTALWVLFAVVLVMAPVLAFGVTGTREYIYDDQRQLKQAAIMPEGVLITYEYDESGNWKSKKVEIDTVAPGAPIVSATTPTKDSTPTWTWISGGDGTGTYRYSLDNADLTTGATETTELTYTPLSALSDGNHTFYVQERDEVGNWSATGSKEVIIDTIVPTLGNVTPSTLVSEQGLSQTFTAVYRDTGGYDNLASNQILINPSASGLNAIWGYYNSNTNYLYLRNDLNTAWIGNGCSPGIAGSISNSQGTINCEQTTITKSGENITVKWNITPSAAFAGTRNIFTKASDKAGNATAFELKGNWNIIAANTPPVLGQLTPSTVTTLDGIPQTFKAVYSDPDGYLNLKYVRFRAGTTADGSSSISLLYNTVSDVLQMYNDQHTALIATNCKAGAAVTLSNSQGALNCQNTLVTKSGNDITVSWNITPDAAFVGVQDIKLKADDQSLATTGFIKKGTWTVSSSAPASEADSVYTVIRYGTNNMLSYTEISDEKLNSAEPLRDIEISVEPTNGAGTGAVSIAVRKSAVPMNAASLKGMYRMAQKSGAATLIEEYEFDGKGNVTITEKKTTEAILRPALTLPYAVSEDGALVIGNLIGQVAEDGKIIVLATGEQNDAPSVVFGAIKGNQLFTQGAYEGAELTNTVSGQKIENAVADGQTIRISADDIATEDGRLIIKPDLNKTDKLQQTGLKLLIRR